MNRKPWISALVLIGLSTLGTGCLVKKTNAVLSTYKEAASSAAGSLAGFKETVWAYSQANCKDCHGNVQPPLFAQQDPELAHVVALSLVNFLQLDASRFYIKSKDRHCGLACSTDGVAMLGLLQQWKTAIEAGQAIPGEEIEIGKVFTHTEEIPLPRAGCNLPDDLALFGANNKCWDKLRFPAFRFSPQTSINDTIRRSWFEVDFAYASYNGPSSTASYVVKNPRIVTPDGGVYVAVVKLFVNGQYRQDYAQAFHDIDKTIPAATFPPAPDCVLPSPNTTLFFSSTTPFAYNVGAGCTPATAPLFGISPSASGIVQEIDPGTGHRDTLSFSFEYYQPRVPADCTKLAKFKSLVFQPIKISAVACLDCHKLNGNSGAAGSRFNMAPWDPVNNPYGTGTSAATWETQLTAAQKDVTLMNVCNKFLQRSVLTVPTTSPIITQPEQGLNGMPPQANFTPIRAMWLDWIMCEAGTHPNSTFCNAP